MPKYKHVPWKQLKTEYSMTIQLSVLSCYIAIIFWFIKGVVGYLSVWSAYICGIYTAMVMDSYIRERFFNKDRMRREIRELCNKEAQRIITLLEAEQAKRDGDEWKR